jgi:hypothetical protein
MEHSHLKGIGGWLTLVSIGLFFTPIILGLSLKDSLSVFQQEFWHAITTYGSELYHPMFGTWIIYEAAINIFTIIFSICLLVLMFRKSRYFPKLMIFYFTSAVLFAGIDYLLGLKVLTDLPALSQALGDDPGIEGLLRSSVQAAVWVPYFIRSKRVKVTFLKKETNIDLEKGSIVK